MVSFPALMSDGQGFGNYRLLRRLARGGMAEVFLARQQGVEGFERRVAIKRILPHLSDSVEFRTMFLDEARLAAQLSHPNIIHIYDFGKVEDYYFIAMEYVDGVDLGRLIKSARTTAMPFELIARILADICAGLHYAHNITDGAGARLNVVHRDVTPQNVLVTYDGIIKVVDFGIAKATWQASRTRPGVVKGKYAYMSPEQVEGRSLDARSDIFSVGICMYELMTGQPLYRRDNVTEAMKEIRDGKPIHPEQYRPDVPHELMAVLKRALETSRDARYPSAAAMQLDLERYLKSAVGLATPQLLGEFLLRETPRGPEGELLTDPKNEDDPASAPAQGPSRPVSIAGKGGTAQISSVKRAVTPAYENVQIDRTGDLVNPPSGDELTAPGKSVRPALGASRSGEVPARDGGSSRSDALSSRSSQVGRRSDAGVSGGGSGATVSLGFEDSDEDLTRKEDRGVSAAETVVTESRPHPRTTPAGGERSLASDPRMSSHRSRSSSYPGSPLGSNREVSEPVPSVRSDSTPGLNGDTAEQPRRRSQVLSVVALLALGVAGGVFAMRHVLSAPHQNTHPVEARVDAAVAARADVPDLRPRETGPGPIAVEPKHVEAADLKPEPKVITTSLPVQTSATIAIHTRPTGAKVFIDGQALEMLTPVRMQPITAGPHHLVIERTGFQPREIDINLQVGEHHVLEYELLEERSLQPSSKDGPKHQQTTPHAKGNGFLTAKTVPWSRAFDGTKLLGETPIVNVPLGEGPHTITFVNPDIPQVKKKIVIKLGEETKLNFNLTDP